MQSTTSAEIFDSVYHVPQASNPCQIDMASHKQAIVSRKQCKDTPQACHGMCHGTSQAPVLCLWAAPMEIFDSMDHFPQEIHVKETWRPSSKQLCPASNARIRRKPAMACAMAPARRPCVEKLRCRIVVIFVPDCESAGVHVGVSSLRALLLVGWLYTDMYALVYGYGA